VVVGLTLLNFYSLQPGRILGLPPLDIPLLPLLLLVVVALALGVPTEQAAAGEVHWLMQHRIRFHRVHRTL
jgi:hypothetical protein